jgi:hypothetical protein
VEVPRDDDAERETSNERATSSEKGNVHVATIVVVVFD